MAVDSLRHSEPDELLHKAAAELRQQLETGQDCRAETVLSAFPCWHPIRNALWNWSSSNPIFAVN
jgi:hypothetical protein